MRHAYQLGLAAAKSKKMNGNPAPVRARILAIL
jgi:hypothetical protein